MAITLGSVAKNVTLAPRITIYGGSGIGKTTFAAGCPDPIFLPLEDGLGKLDVQTFPLLKTFQDVLDAIGSLYAEKHKFKTVVVDSLDWLEPIIWQHVCEFWTDKKGNSNRLKSIEDAGYGKGYIEASGYWMQFLNGMDALRSKGMIVLFICHMQTIKIEDPLRASYDMYSLKLHKRATALISEYSDMILYATTHISQKTEDEGFNKKRVRAISNGSRIIHTVGQPAFLAKNRYGLPETLPLEWQAISEKI